MIRPVEKGFTLIEALIAFLVLSVGIVGALLFHASLIGESGNNKARLEAISIADAWAEEQRNKVHLSAASFAAEMSGMSSVNIPVSGALNTYTLVVTSVSSPSSNVYKLDYAVNWDPSQSVTFSSFFGWLDTSELIDPTEVGEGSGDPYNNPKLPLPSGTLSEIPRIQVASAAVVTGNLVADRSNETVNVYKDGDDYKVAVELEDGVYVQLAELSNVNNEIFTITGRIYLNQGAYLTSRGFGKVYGTSSTEQLLMAGESSGDLVENKDYYRYVEEDKSEKFFRNNVIDVRASAGANCVVGRFKNSAAVTTKIKGTNYKVYPGIYGDYICVAGSGWNGTVKPYFRNYDGTKLNDIVIGDLNCAPSLRSFRYYIIESSNLNALKAKQDFSQWASSDTVANILSSTSSAIVGQSGLVRFYTDEAQRTTVSSAEGVFWNQYFWHNPNYLIDPSFDGGPFTQTPTIDGPDPVVDLAYKGYKAPAVSSFALRSFEVAQPGDVSHQNFYISASGTGGGALDNCNEVLDYMLVTGTPKVTNADPYAEAPGASGFMRHSHLVSLGVPGYEVGGSNRAYLPPVPSHAFVSSDFNRATVSGSPEIAGTIILGYTLATDSVGGTLTIPSGASYSNDLVIAGNPEPVISITCSVDPDTLDTAVVSGALTYNYSCGVPVNWVGEVFSYPEAGSSLSRCTGFSEDDNQSPNYLWIDVDGVINVGDIETNATNSPSIWHYYQEVVSGATAGASTVSAALFQPLEFYDVDDATSADAGELNFRFCY